MIEFILNDKKITTESNPSMVLVDFIRELKNLKGTKIVCREGDCGACSVLVGSWNEDMQSVQYQTITSCISPLANAAGHHIVTVEGLNLKSGLNRVQQVLKDHHASQCGFCTPGFVVSLLNYCLNPKSQSSQQALDAISGNICRCTGYVSIIKAAKQLVEECMEIGDENVMQRLIEDGFLPEYFADIPAQMKVLSQKIHKVTGHQIVAGGTDLYVQRADDLVQKIDLRFITKEQGQEICVEGDRCSISGIATVSDLFHDDELSEKIPGWKDYLRLLSSEPIRNMATLSGNFVNASPIGDMTAMMLALDTVLLIAEEDNSRKVKLKDFFLDYKKVDLKDNESIAKMDFILPSASTRFNFEKVSKRQYLDIATVNSAACIEVSAMKITQAHISMGGVAAIPKYLNKTCEYLIGNDLNENTLSMAVKIMHEEIAPISDVRGASDYKRKLAENLFKSHFIQMFPEHFDFKKVVSS